MQKIYLLHRNRWIKEAEKMGLKESDCLNIEAKLCTVRYPEEVDKIFLDSVGQILKQRKIKDITELHNFVRDFQCMFNHHIFQDSSGKDTSFFLQEVVSAKEEYGRHVPKDLGAFLELAYASHTEIDNFFSQEEKRKDEVRRTVLKSLKKLNKEIEEGELNYEEELNSLGINPCQISISHYILDWYLQLSPFDAYRKTPRKLAAIAMYGMKRFNEEITGYISTDFTNRDLSKFGDWSSSSGVAGAGFSAYFDILYNVEDLSLLIINLLGLSAEAERKLAEIIEKRENQTDLFIIINQGKSEKCTCLKDYQMSQTKLEQLIER